MTSGPAAVDTTSRRGLIAGLVLGLPVMAYAVRGALVDAHLTHPAELARWIVGLAVVHDLVVVPAVLGIGLALRRRLPAVARVPVRAALLTSAVLVLVGWPFVRGYGRNPDVPSLLPRDYTAGLLAALAVTWTIAGLWIAAGRRRPTRAPLGDRSRDAGSS
jgi:hypothetical protein